MKGATTGNKPKAFGSAQARKERDEDLLLFREMFKREKERNVVSLLEPVSSEFESTQGSFPLYKLPSGKKGSGNDFLGGEKDKNDYDWLKTPPATPLFPSLEMEAANDPNMIFQRELPILYHIKPSRFSAKAPEEPKQGQRPKSPSTRSTTSSKSSTSTQSQTNLSSRPTSSSGNATTLKSAMNNNNNLPERRYTSTARSSTLASTTKENPRNTSASMRQNSDSQPQSRRGISPNVRPLLPATLMPGFSDETPTNLITSAEKIQGRAISTNRVRSSVTSTSILATVEPKVVDAGRLRRQSCSPSVVRGRKVEGGENIGNLGGKSKNVTNNNPGNGTLVMGSKMVERMMNARRPMGVEEKGLLQAKDRNLGNERPGVGKLMSRTALDMALKQMEISKNPIGFKSTNTHGSGSSTKPSSSSRTTTQSSDVRNSTRIRTTCSNENKFPIKKGESKTRT